MMSSIKVRRDNAKDAFGRPFCVGWGTNASKLALQAKRRRIRFAFEPKAVFVSF